MQRVCKILRVWENVKPDKFFKQRQLELLTIVILFKRQIYFQILIWSSLHHMQYEWNIKTSFIMSYSFNCNAMNTYLRGYNLPVLLTCVAFGNQLSYSNKLRTMN